MNNPNTIATTTLFEHPLVRIVKDTVELDGARRHYYCLESPVDAVATVAVDSQNRILLTRQYRHGLRAVIFDLPSGRLEPGEDPASGARREFEEETGFFPNRFQLLTRYCQFPGMLRVMGHLYFASDLAPTKQNLDDGEALEVVPMPVPDVLSLIMRGEAVDASLQLGVLMAVQKGLLGA